MKFTSTSSRLVEAMQTDVQQLRLGKSGVQARKDVRRARRATRAAVATDAHEDANPDPDLDLDGTVLPFSTHPVKTDSENKLVVSLSDFYRSVHGR